MGINRAFELFSLSKARQVKRDKEAVDVEYEKQCDECTFQPNITTSQQSRFGNNNPMLSESTMREADKVVERLRRGKNERDQSKYVVERGFYTGAEGHFIFSLDRDVQPQKKFQSIY